jgi:hypothetical protein
MNIAVEMADYSASTSTILYHRSIQASPKAGDFSTSSSTKPYFTTNLKYVSKSSYKSFPRSTLNLKPISIID